MKVHADTLKRAEKEAFLCTLHRELSGEIINLSFKRTKRHLLEKCTYPRGEALVCDELRSDFMTKFDLKLWAFVAVNNLPSNSSVIDVFQG